MMHIILQIKIQPHFSLRILFELFYHQLITTNAGGPVNALHCIAMDIFAHPSRMRCDIG